MYDINDWTETMKGGPLEILLKGHLWLEVIMNDFLTYATNDSKALDIDRQSFSAKLNICEAFSLFSESRANTYRVINRKRNRLAHDIKHSFTEESYAEIFSSLDDRLKAGLASLLDGSDLEGQSEDERLATKLQMLLLMVASDTGYALARYKYEKENSSQISSYHLVRTLIRELGSNFETDEETKVRIGLEDPPNPEIVWGTTTGDWLDHGEP